jgi:hypothetical protein
MPTASKKTKAPVQAAAVRGNGFIKLSPVQVARRVRQRQDERSLTERESTCDAKRY